MRLTILLCCLLAVSSAYADNLPLPGRLAGKAVVLHESDPDYPRAVLSGAIKPAGDGGISNGIVIKTTADIPVYRLWSGPSKKDQNGNTNRLGAWWSYDELRGDVTTYRRNYEICNGWNDLQWAVTCVLKLGSVVTIGPGQSVSAILCHDQTGKEEYPANPDNWQLYIDRPWTRQQELSCPDIAADYEVDPTDISQRRKRVPTPD